MFHRLKGSWLDTLTNILTVVVAIVFIVLVTQRYILPSKPEAIKPQVGNFLVLEGFDPSQNDRNVFLVLMKGCKFCEESVDFYKTLIPSILSHDQRVAAVFSAETKDATSYLTRLGIKDLPIITLQSLADIKVGGTPTIIVTNKTGEIIAVWDGKLSKEREIEVFKFLAL